MSLPEELLAATDLEKTKIDTAFSEMVADREYQAEALQIEAEFATASWGALQVGEANEYNEYGLIKLPQ